MEIFTILLTILMAVIFGTLFFYIFKYTGPWGTFWSFILILILVGLAAATWIEPVGPIYRDVAWLPILFVILIFAFFLAAATPPEYRVRSRKLADDTLETRETAPEAALSIFFWSFLVLLLVAAVWGAFR